MAELTNRVKVRITCEVITTLDLGAGETIEQFQQRCADIYLHGAGDNGHFNKVDLGGLTTIEVLRS